MGKRREREKGNERIGGRRWIACRERKTRRQRENK